MKCLIMENIFFLKREKNPENDLKRNCKCKIEGEELTQEFLDGSWLLIVFAGNDTTRNTMSGVLSYFMIIKIKRNF